MFLCGKCVKSTNVPFLNIFVFPHSHVTGNSILKTYCITFVFLLWSLY